MTYGAVAPIPDIVHLAINNYSRHDIVVDQYAHRYLDKLPIPLELEDEALKFVAADLKLKNHLYKNTSLDHIVADIKKSRIKDESIYIPEYPHDSTKNGYTLKVINSEVPLHEIPFGKKDHNFAGATYQKALKKNIEFIRTEYKIHDCR